jgi:hypothetical protein
VSDFSLDLDDTAVRERLRDLKEEYAEEPVYIVSADAEYAVYLEFGTRDMPPYPFFRPAIKELEANPETFLLENTELDGLGELETTNDVVKAVADALTSQMKTNATAEASGRSPGTHPDHPQVQSGNLRFSIDAQRIN